MKTLFVPLCAAVCMLLCTASSAVAQRAGTETSGSAPESGIITGGSAIDTPIVGAEEKSDSDSPALAGATPTVGDADRSLGAPNGAFSVRPRDEQDTAADDAGVFSAVDPRSNGVARVIASLGVVLALLFGVRFLLKRSTLVLGGARPSGVVEILARYPVAKGQHLLLVKLARRILLVHQSGSAMATLTEVSDADEVAALLSRIESGTSGKTATRFRGVLDQFRREHDDANQPSGAIPFPARGPVIDLTRKKPAPSTATRKRWRLSA